MVKRKTAKSRLKRALAALSEWCRKNRHLPVKEQYQKLTQKLRGHNGSYGIIGNFYCLQEFREVARVIWRRWLSRRRRGKPTPWFGFSRLEERYSLPRAGWSTAWCAAQRSHERRSRMPRRRASPNLWEHGAGNRPG